MQEARVCLLHFCYVSEAERKSPRPGTVEAEYQSAEGARRLSGSDLGENPGSQNPAGAGSVVG